jgi:hypothetical protein
MSALQAKKYNNIKLIMIIIKVEAVVTTRAKLSKTFGKKDLIVHVFLKMFDVLDDRFIAQGWRGKVKRIKGLS